MNQSVSPQNRRWVLASRPQGAPVAENFRLETQPVRGTRRGAAFAAYRLAVAGSLYAGSHERCAILFTAG